MSQFRVSREGLLSLNEIQVSYTCMAPGMDPGKLAGLNPDGCEKRSASAKAYEVDCGAGFAVRSWRVSSTESIDYFCCAVAPSDGEEPPISTEATLDSSLQGSVPLYQLAALNYDCPTGQALRKFKIDPSVSGNKTAAEFLCINVPLLRQVREINEQLQTVQWDQFRGSWVLARVPNVQVRTPIANIVDNKAVAVCGANAALEAFAFGNHGNENQISTVNSCRKIQMDDSSCNIKTDTAAPGQAQCELGEEVIKEFNLTPTAANKPNPPFYSIEYTCCQATKSAAPDGQAQCSTSVTATRPAGTLKPWKFVLTEPDMAIDCQERMLTGFTIDYTKSNQEIAINYTCCSFETFSEQMGGVVSNAFQPQDFTQNAETTTPAEVRRVDVSARNSSNRQETFVSFKLDGALFNESVFEDTDFHVLVLNRLTHRFQDYRSFGDISVVGNADEAAIYLNELQPETMIVVGVAAVASWFPKLEYALQRCGAKSLQQTQSGPYGMVGVCRTADAEDSRAAVTELWDSTNVEITAILPFLYTAAPIAEFPARFVQTVEAQDPFPAERPLKPELVIFKPENVEYDEFCDLNTRRSMKNIDCEVDQSKCPEEGHPCAHTYEKKMDEPEFWTTTQRDIDRGYVEGLAEVQQAKLDYQIAQFEEAMAIAEFVATIAAGAFAAAAPGSWGTPAEEGAESTADAQETAGKNAKVAATQPAQDLPIPDIQVTPPGGTPPVRNAVRGPPPVPEKSPKRVFKKDVAWERFANLGDIAEDGLTSIQTFGTIGYGEAADNIDQKGEKDRKANNKVLKFKGGEIEAIPPPEKPDDVGKGTWLNMKNYNLAGWLDDDPIQVGLSRIMCDLYCTEDAVKAGNNAININVVRSSFNVQNNIERLLDFQSKLIFFGLGQLRDQLKPTPSEARALLQSDEVPGEVQQLLAEMNEVPKLLETDFDPSKSSSLALTQWYKTAGKKLTDRVEGIFAYRNASSESVAAVRKLVETFVAQRRLRQERLSDAPEAGGRAATRPEFIQVAIAQKTGVVREFVKRHDKDLSRVVSMVGAAKSVLYGNSFLEKAGSSLLLLRWNQISAAMAEAHRKQSQFADSKKRALKAAKEALNAADSYIHCKGSTIADLQMTWQRAVRLSDESGSVLLDAWGSTQEAHELLETAAAQGLLQDMADMASVPTPEVKECLGLVSLVRISHYQGVKAIDKALSPVLAQVLVLDVISRYQEREIKRMDLEVSQKRRSVRSFMEQLGGIAKRVARPGPEGLKLAARAMNLFGSQICPAPAGCEGMLLNMSQLTHLKDLKDQDGNQLHQQLQGPWVSSQPGDFLLQKLPTMTPCKPSETVPIQPHAGLEMLQSSVTPKTGPVEELTVPELVQELLSRVNGQSLLSIDMTQAHSLVHKVCQDDCSQLFQEKLVRQSSALDQIADVWLATID